MRTLHIEGKMRIISSFENEDAVIIAGSSNEKIVTIFADEADVQKIHDWTSEWLAARAAKAPKTIPVVAGDNWEDEPKPYATGAFLFTPPVPAEYVELKVEEDE